MYNIRASIKKNVQFVILLAEICKSDKHDFQMQS